MALGCGVLLRDHRVFRRISLAAQTRVRCLSICKRYDTREASLAGFQVLTASRGFRRPAPSPTTEVGPPHLSAPMPAVTSYPLDTKPSLNRLLRVKIDGTPVQLR